jgi:hypothetical protein
MGGSVTGETHQASPSDFGDRRTHAVVGLRLVGIPDQVAFVSCVPACFLSAPKDKSEQPSQPCELRGSW